jgi:hypothetical protein
MHWIIFSLIALQGIPLGWLVGLFGPRLLLQRRGQRVMGTIIRVDKVLNEGWSFVPVIRYMTQQGEVYEFRPRFFSGAPFQSALNQEVTVFYERWHPQRAMFLHSEYAILRRFLWIAVLALTGCTLLFWLLTIWFPTLFPW